MAVTPTSRENLPLMHYRNLIAESAAFRAMVGVGTPAEALARIFYFRRTPLGGAFAVVGYESEGLESQEVAVGAFNWSGSFNVLFRMATDPNEPEEDRQIRFTNFTGKIMEEVEIAARAYGFRLAGFARVLGPELNSPNEVASAGNYAVAIYRVSYWD